MSSILLNPVSEEVNNINADAKKQFLSDWQFREIPYLVSENRYGRYRTVPYT